jgi:uncharacterized GH25 family protein
MKTMLKKSLGIAALLALSANPVLAHRFWIIPSTSVLSGENAWVSFDAAISNNLFFANHVAAPLQSMTVTGPDGKAVEVQNGKEGKIRTTFDIELAKPGTYKVASVRSMFSAQWKEGEEVKRWRGPATEFAKQDLKGKPELKVFENHTRVETVVTSGEPSSEVLKPTGKGLELVVEKNHPNDLFAGEKASFGLVLNGAPAANVKVTVVKGDDRYRNEPGETVVTTNDKGVFEVSFSEPGRYWLNATLESEAGEFEGVPMGRRVAYTTTFEVLPE